MPKGIKDNYIDEYFLKGLSIRNSFPDLHYWSMIRKTSEVVHLSNSLFFFYGCFFCLVNQTFAEEYILAVTLAVMLICYFVYSFFEYHKRQWSVV
mmetsp:Transcript_6480/g.8449  ORF Transcript_6480/g.8449 Transcript_6480/m.8449 type:complete len:95 (+) Transcript_6480:128-412(+)